MFTWQCGSHRLIVCIRPQATDLTPPLVASNLEAIFAESLQHGQPAGAWLSGVSNLNLHRSNLDTLTSTNNGDRLLPHPVL